MDERKRILFEIKLAEVAERFDDMKDGVRKLIFLKLPLNSKERRLLAAAYNNLVNDRRTSWRIINSIEEKEQEIGSGQKLPIIKEYKREIEKELSAICAEFLEVLNFIPFDNTVESKVFHYRMKGDYHRYLAEFLDGKDYKKAIGYSLLAYINGFNFAKEGLTPTHPLRLGQALNFSVLYYDILDCKDLACTIAMEAYNNAFDELDNVPDDSEEDTLYVMDLLWNNLTQWTSDSLPSLIIGPLKQSQDNGDQKNTLLKYFNEKK